MPLRDITAQKSTFKKEACVNEKCKGEKVLQNKKKVKKGQMGLLVIETIKIFLYDFYLHVNCRVIS